MPLSFSRVGSTAAVCLGTAPKRKSSVKVVWWEGQEVGFGHHQLYTELLLLPTLLAWIEPKPVDPRSSLCIKSHHMQNSSSAAF